MVRPHASESSKCLAVLFATTVTTEVRGVAPASASVGRSGEYSVFEALSICFPHASRDTSRNGISLVELNKALENACSPDSQRFTRVRFRNPRNPRRRKGDAEAKNSTRKWRDPENQSFYRYGNRRWRDPDDEDDLQYLRQAWPLVNQMSAATCSLLELCHVLRRAINADRESEAVQRKLVGLPEASKLPSSAPLSTVASAAATPVRGTPIPMNFAEKDEEGSTDSELSDSDDEWIQTVYLNPPRSKPLATQPTLNISALSPSPIPLAPRSWGMPPPVPVEPLPPAVKVEMETWTGAGVRAEEMGLLASEEGIAAGEEALAVPWILQREASTGLKEEGLLALLGCSASSQGCIGKSW